MGTFTVRALKHITQVAWLQQGRCWASPSPFLANPTIHVLLLTTPGSHQSPTAHQKIKPEPISRGHGHEAMAIVPRAGGRNGRQPGILHNNPNYWLIWAGQGPKFQREKLEFCTKEPVLRGTHIPVPASWATNTPDRDPDLGSAHHRQPLGSALCQAFLCPHPGAFSERSKDAATRTSLMPGDRERQVRCPPAIAGQWPGCERGDRLTRKGQAPTDPSPSARHCTLLRDSHQGLCSPSSLWNLSPSRVSVFMAWPCCGLCEVSSL